MKKQAFYTLVQQFREIEQLFTQFEWQLIRLEPEDFARQWGDNTRKFEAGDEDHGWGDDRSADGSARGNLVDAVGHIAPRVTGRGVTRR